MHFHWKNLFSMKHNFLLNADYAINRVSWSSLLFDTTKSCPYSSLGGAMHGLQSGLCCFISKLLSLDSHFKLCQNLGYLLWYRNFLSTWVVIIRPNWDDSLKFLVDYWVVEHWLWGSLVYRVLVARQKDSTACYLMAGWSIDQGWEVLECLHIYTRAPTWKKLSVGLDTGPSWHLVLNSDPQLWTFR